MPIGPVPVAMGAVGNGTLGVLEGGPLRTLLVVVVCHEGYVHVCGEPQEPHGEWKGIASAAGRIAASDRTLSTVERGIVIGCRGVEQVAIVILPLKRVL